MTVSEDVRLKVPGCGVSYVVFAFYILLGGQIGLFSFCKYFFLYNSRMSFTEYTNEHFCQSLFP